MAPSNFFFSLLFSFFFFILAMKKVESQNTSFAINTFTPHSRLLIYERDAFVPPDKPYVSLVGVFSNGLPQSNSVGRVLYNTPVDLWSVRRQASFETTITLEMWAPYPPSIVGHGITFFMIPVNSTTPIRGTGENLGIYNTVDPGTPLFAVEFDIANGIWFNPPYPHIGININSPRSQNFSRFGSVDIRQHVTARITYDARTKMISVVARANGTVTETRVSLRFDLAAILPQRVQVGLSASTGDFKLAFLEAYTWRFDSTMEDDIIGSKPSVM